MKKLFINVCVAALIVAFMQPVAVNASSYQLQEAPESSARDSESSTRDADKDLSTQTEPPVQPEETTSPAPTNMPTESPVPSQGPEETTSPVPAVTNIPVSIQNVAYKKKNITFTWEGVDEASEYVILQEKEGEWEEVLRTEDLNTTVSVPDYGEVCTFKIEAYQVDGALVGISDEIEIAIPKKAEKLKTTALSKEKVKLTWGSSEGAASYQIYSKKGKGEYKLIETKQGFSTKLVTKFNETYHFKVIPIFESDAGSVRGEAGSIIFQNREFVSLSHQKYSYSEMGIDIQALCKKYSEYVSCDIIGYSERGRKIYDVILGNKEAENTILVVSTLHGREYIATAICMKQLEYYLLHYNDKVDGKKLSNVFKNCNVHYVMMANPDGVKISQTSRSSWKGNANGVNLNRNFPYAFRVNGSPKKQSYSGPKAASEAETKAVVRLTKKLKKTQKLAVVNYHAMGNIVFGDYGGRNKRLRSDIRKMYNIARGATGYRSAAGYGGSSNGNYREYLSYVLKIPSVTLEIGSVSCPVPQYQYSSGFSRNRLVVLREAAWLAKGN